MADKESDGIKSNIEIERKINLWKEDFLSKKDL